MMAELFDEKYFRDQYNKSRDKEMLAEGETKGMINTLADLVKKGLLNFNPGS